MDIASSQKAGVSALLQGIGAVRGGLYESALVVASEKRRVQAGSPGELAYGDGAAALTVGQEGVLAEFVAAQSSTVDFIDHFRGATEAYDYTWEERWIRDEGLAKIAPPCIEQALAKAGLDAGAVDHFIMPSTIGRAVAGIAPQGWHHQGRRRRQPARRHGGERRGPIPWSCCCMFWKPRRNRARPSCCPVSAKAATFWCCGPPPPWRTTEAPNGIVDALARRQVENNYQKFLRSTT